jgi:hypothetical protein
MKVLLRHPETGLFYAGSERWTQDDNEAIDFEATDRAMDEVWEAKLNHIEVLMKFDNPTFEIPLTVVGLGK